MYVYILQHEEERHKSILPPKLHWYRSRI